jgi:hypothetical protein
MTDLNQLAHDVAELRGAVDYLTILAEPGLSSPNAAATTRISGAAFMTPGLATTPPAGPTAAHVWHSLTPADAARAWDVLTTWVDWLIDRYSLDDTVPACWYAHGAIVEELDALRAGWDGAYLDPNARMDPAYWHEVLSKTLTRIREWDRYGCAAGTHHDEAPGTPHDQVRQARETRTRRLQTDTHTRNRDALPCLSEGRTQ